MKAQKIKIQQYQKLLTITLVLILSLFVLCQTANAQNAPNDKSLKSYKKPPNLKKYFQDKYKDQIDMDMITSNLQETPQGPRGKLHLSGHIKPKNVEATSGDGDKATRARAIAKAFLKDESELFGLPDLNELREYKIITSKGLKGEYTQIYYTRYIDDWPLDNSRAHIVIGPDESITSMYVTLTPAPSELYQAVAKKLITESEATEIVERDMKAHRIQSKGMSISSIHKYALTKPPYVVWIITIGTRVNGWAYTINAITGDIILKNKPPSISED